MKYFVIFLYFLFGLDSHANELQLDKGGLVSFHKVMESSCDLFHVPKIVGRVLERHSDPEVLSRYHEIKRRALIEYKDSVLANKKNALSALGFAGAKLFFRPDEKSKVVGYFLHMGLDEMPEIKLGQIKSCWWEGGEGSSPNDKAFVNEFIDEYGEHVSWLNEYVNYPARFWELKEGQPEQYDMKWYHENLCKGDTRWNVCKQPTRYVNTPIYPAYFYVRDSIVHGPNKVEKKYVDVWRQLPFKIGGVYPWILQKRVSLFFLKTNPKVGESFNDMIGKDVEFTVMPEYFESADGSTIYLRKHSRELEFSGKEIVKLVNGYDYNFQNIKITKTTPEHMYFTFGSGKYKKMIEARVGAKELFRANGSIRLRDNTRDRYDYSDYVLPLKVSGDTK